MFSIHFNAICNFTVLNYDVIYVPTKQDILPRRIIAIKWLFPFIANAITNNIFKTYCNSNENNEKLLK